MKKVFTLIVVFCVAVVPSVFAQEPLHWDEVLAETIARQPKLKGAAYDVESAGYDAKISKSAIFPQLTAASAFRRGETSTSDWANSYTHSLSASFLLFDGFKTPYALKAARKRIDQEQFAYEVISSDILLDVRTAFVDLMEAQDMIALTQGIRDRKKQNLEMVELRYEGGKEHKGAFLTAEAELANAEFDVREAERNLVLSRRKLLIAMGIDTMEDVHVDGAFRLSEGYLVKPDLSGLLDSIPFLGQLAAAREAALLDQRSTKGEIWPSVSAVSALSKSGDEIWGDDRGLLFGLSVSVPIFEGGQNIARIKRSHVAFLKAEATEQNGRQELLLTLEDRWKKLKDAMETVGVREKFLQASEERAKIASAQYGTGLIDFDAWIIIENNLVSAQKNYLSARADMLQSEAQWIHSLGGALHDEIY